MKENHACVQTSVVNTVTHTKQGRMSRYTQGYIIYFRVLFVTFFNSLRLMKMSFGTSNHAKDVTLI